MKGRILFAVLGHGPAENFSKIARRWQKVAGDHGLLLVHGGRKEDFEALDFPDKVWVDDPRLRTKSHPMEKQSYCGAWKAVAGWLNGRDFETVYWAEFDELPVALDLGERLLGRMAEERADVLGRRVERVDGTNDAHWLYHEYDPRYRACFEEASRRPDRQVILSMLGTGSFWSREAFLQVAGHPESAPCYLELFLPTMAHHLGFRVRDMGGQSRFIGFEPKSAEEVESDIRAGAWTVHPVKDGGTAER